MLFDPRPKSKRSELFGRDRELELLRANIDAPLILITGIRRIGKTSLLNVFVNEIDIPGVVIDLRGLPVNYGLRDLYGLLSKAFSSKLDKLYEVLRSISGVRVGDFGVEIKWRGRGALTLSSLFDALNRKRIVLAFDEAQRLRGPRSREFLEALAHAYDYDRNITFILTGSEVGLLYEFLGVDSAESPLYGRYYYELRLERFDEETSLAFLKAGFREAGLEIEEEVLELIVEEFDGIPGWLAFAGNEYIRGNRDLARVRELAVNVALGELRNLIEGRGRRYAIALRGLAEGYNAWGSLKRYIEEREGTAISPSVLYNVIRSLEEMSLIRDYEFLDPIYREAALRL